HKRRVLIRPIKDEYAKAIIDLDKILALAPEQSMFTLRGHARRMEGQCAKALEDFQEALRLAPDDAERFTDLARLHATCDDDQLRDAKRAIELGTKACALSGWRSTRALDALAIAYAADGDFENAVTW